MYIPNCSRGGILYGLQLCRNICSVITQPGMVLDIKYYKHKLYEYDIWDGSNGVAGACKQITE
jgi:hypothetical protein